MPDTSQIEDWRLDEWERFERDYPYFASECLVIRPKDPTKGLTPFVLNTAQTYLHKVAERQRAKTGKVRIIVLKGRQEGISTYVCGRLYWRASFSRGATTRVSPSCSCPGASRPSSKNSYRSNDARSSPLRTSFTSM